MVHVVEDDSEFVKPYAVCGKGTGGSCVVGVMNVIKHTPTL